MPTSTRLAPLVALLLLVPGHATAAEGKIRMHEKDGSFNIDTPSNAGDVVMDGESLNGLFATVEALQNQVDMLMGVTTTTATTTTTTATTLTTMAVDSSIFKNNAQVDAIKGWVQSDFPAFAGKAVTLERCYSMAEAGDGGLATTFIAACTEKGPTVTVVKSWKGHIFGGATDTSWGPVSAGNVYQASDAAFLFCIECFVDGAGGPYSPHQLPLTGTDNSRAMYRSTAYGPTFGGGHDLFIADQPGHGSTATSTGRSYSELGLDYTCPIGNYQDTACRNYFDGAKVFEADDYEIFVLKAT